MQAYNRPRPRLNIIGGGITGLTVATRALGHYPDLHIYEKYPIAQTGYRSASGAAAAEFLPLAGEGSLRFQRAQYEIIKDVLPKSRLMYERLSRHPEITGVRKVTLVEPSNERNRWLTELRQLMRARRHRLETPFVLERQDGSHCTYDMFYVCESFAIDTATLMEHLRDTVVAAGGTWHHETIDPDKIEALEGITVQAAGVSAGKFTPITFNKDWGISGRLEGYTAPPVMISTDDMVIAPNAGVLVAGGGNFTAEPTVADIATFKRRLVQLSQATAGPWRPLPMGTVEKLTDFHIGSRPTALEGLMVRRNPLHEGVVDANGQGHAGVTLAYGIAEKVLGMVSELELESKQNPRLLVQ